MKQAMIDYSIRGAYDELFTPEIAIHPIVPYLPKEWIYWECTDGGTSKISSVLRSKGYTVISTGYDVTTGEGFNFLTDTPDFKFDCIITNPPYSLKNEFLKRCYDLNSAFTMLMPLTTLESVYRHELFSKYGISVVVLDRRIDFTGKKSCWFNTSWFCWKLPLDKQLIFEKVGDVDEHI